MIPIPITKEIKYAFMHHSKIFNRQQQLQQVKPRKNNVTKIQKKTAARPSYYRPPHQLVEPTVSSITSNN